MDQDDLHIRNIMLDYPFLTYKEAIFWHFSETIKSYEKQIAKLDLDLKHKVINTLAYNEEMSKLCQDRSLFIASMKMKELMI